MRRAFGVVRSVSLVGQGCFTLLLFAAFALPRIMHAQECQTTVTYDNGRTLKGPSGAYFYRNGRTLRSNAGAVYFPGGRTLQSQSGTLYYPNGRTLATAGGSIYYPTGRTLRTSGGFYYHPNGRTLKTSGGTFYYSNGTTARSGGVLRDPGGTATSVPLRLEEAMGDFGRLFVDITSNNEGFDLRLQAPFIETTEIRRFDSEWDTVHSPRFVISIDTGRPNESVVLSISGLITSCRLQRGANGT